MGNWDMSFFRRPPGSDAGLGYFCQYNRTKTGVTTICLEKNCAGALTVLQTKEIRLVEELVVHGVGGIKDASMIFPGILLLSLGKVVQAKQPCAGARIYLREKSPNEPHS